MANYLGGYIPLKVEPQLLQMDRRLIVKADGYDQLPGWRLSVSTALAVTYSVMDVGLNLGWNTATSRPATCITIMRQ